MAITICAFYENGDTFAENSLFASPDLEDEELSDVEYDVYANLTELEVLAMT